MIDHLIASGALSGPHRRPSLAQRLWARMKPLPEGAGEEGRYIAVVLDSDEHEVDDVISFSDREEAEAWIAENPAPWADGRVALWKERGPNEK